MKQSHQTRSKWFRHPGLAWALLGAILGLSAILVVLIGYALIGGDPDRAAAPVATSSAAGEPASPTPPVQQPDEETNTPPPPTPAATATPVQVAQVTPTSTKEATASPPPTEVAHTPWPPALQAAVAWRPAGVPSEAELRTMVAGMPLRAKVGQLLMVGFRGRSIARSPELATMVGDHHVGGVVMVESNAHHPEQVRRLTAELQSLATSRGQGIPLFIAINQEGGIVVRITEGVTGFPGNMALAAASRPDYAYLSAALTAYELRLLGVNMNLAPVLDINDNPLNPVIGTRSFGSSTVQTAEYGRLAVQGTQDAGVIAVAKHFPGHGGVAADSHGTLPVIESSLEALLNHEVVPFVDAVEAGVEAIMTAHIAVPALDSSGRPATLSPEILTGLLRQRLGFDGLIVTDSLGMKGVRAGRGQVQAALEAIQAGADVLLTTTPMDVHIEILDALKQAVRQGQIPVERIDESVVRILRVKYAYGLFQVPQAVDLAAVGTAEHQAVADEIARRAVTVLRDDGGNLPLPPPPARLLLISPHDLPPATTGPGTALAELLQGQGYTVTETILDLDSQASRDEVYATALAQPAAYEAIIFGEWALISRYVNRGDTWQETLIDHLARSTPRLIVVAWYNPTAVLRCEAAPTFLTAYGNTRSQVAAVAAVLVGEQVPGGQLPIELGAMGSEP